MSQIFLPFFEEASSILLLLAAGFFFAASIGTIFYCRLICRRIEQDRLNQRDLIENLHEGIFRATLDGQQIIANKALVKLNGYDSEEEMLAAGRDSPSEWHVLPSSRDEFYAKIRRDGFAEDFVTEVYRLKTRERIWVNVSARLVHDRRSGKPLYYEGSVREITEKINRRNADERLRKLSNQVPGGLIQITRCSSTGTFYIPYASDGLRAVYNLDPHGPLPTAAEFSDMVHPDDRQSFDANIKASRANNGTWNQEYRVIVSGGTEKWLQINAKAEPVEGGVIWHGYVSDITARKQATTEIEKLAYYDPLTGLPNRRTFLDQMKQAIEECRLQNHNGALIFIDLDNFKMLNDTRGHDAGDAFLVEAALRLKNCVGQHDTVARIGGDEFVVILQDAGSNMAQATQTATLAGNRMLSALRKDFVFGGFSHRSSGSIGIVVFDGNAGSADDVFKQADIAMYRAKSSGRNNLSLYDHSTMSAQTERYQLLDDLKVALSQGALDLLFQPVMNGSGHVEGAEALCRWLHPRLGELQPKQFVPLTEQFGLIHEFNDLVLAKSLAELARWQENPALAGIRLSVTVNAQVMTFDNFVTNLAAQIKSHGINPQLLTLEMTESVIAKDPRALARQMLALKKLGLRLSLDDFGASYSSLAYLKRMPFDELKIDGSFITDIERSESNRQLVKSILGTARTLKLETVAGHVTTKGQERLLNAFGCDYFQGALYSPALPADDFVKIAENHLCRRRKQQRIA